MRVLLSANEGKLCSTRIHMNDFLAQPDHPDLQPTLSVYQPSVKRSRMRLLGLLFSLFTGLFILLAFGSSALLLLKDTSLSLLEHLAHAPISALPLFLIGVASLCFQVVTRPSPLDLFKACLVSSAFILWGIDQLLPAGWLATTLGDIVIILYVIDLGWMMADRLKQQGWRKPAQQNTQPLHLLAMSPATGPAEPLPMLSTWPQETPPESSALIKLSTSPSSVLKRYRLVPLRAAERR